MTQSNMAALTPAVNTQPTPTDRDIYATRHPIDGMTDGVTTNLFPEVFQEMNRIRDEIKRLSDALDVHTCDCCGKLHSRHISDIEGVLRGLRTALKPQYRERAFQLLDEHYDLLSTPPPSEHAATAGDWAGLASSMLAPLCLDTETVLEYLLQWCSARRLYWVQGRMVEASQEWSLLPPTSDGPMSLTDTNAV